jgi:anaerobic dimethyl sulfoxide reductase subunit A
MEEWLKAAYDEVRKIETELPEFEKFTEAGGYKYKNRQDFIAFEKQIKDFSNHPFPTPSGKIEVFSQRLYEMNQPKEIPAIPKYVPSFEGPEDELTRKYPLQLIGWHTKRRCHSVHDHNDWHAAIDKQEVWIHPKDAAARGIKEGDSVEVWNDRGRMQVAAHITHRIVEGVTAVSQGAWYRPNRKGMDTNGSINILTTSRPTPLAKGNPQHSNLVEIQLSTEE